MTSYQARERYIVGQQQICGLIPVLFHLRDLFFGWFYRSVEMETKDRAIPIAHCFESEATVDSIILITAFFAFTSSSSLSSTVPICHDIVSSRSFTFSRIVEG